MKFSRIFMLATVACLITAQLPVHAFFGNNDSKDKAKNDAHTTVNNMSQQFAELWNGAKIFVGNATNILTQEKNEAKRVKNDVAATFNNRAGKVMTAAQTAFEDGKDILQEGETLAEDVNGEMHSVINTVEGWTTKSKRFMNKADNIAKPLSESLDDLANTAYKDLNTSTTFTNEKGERTFTGKFVKDNPVFCKRGILASFAVAIGSLFLLRSVFNVDKKEKTFTGHIASMFAGILL